MRNPSRWRSLATLGTILVLMTALQPALALATPGTTLDFEPSFVLARQGETARLEIWVNNAVDLARIEFTANYDVAGLEALDADPGREGIQMELGPVFAGGYNPLNNAAGGILELVASRFPGDGSFDGRGMVAAVTFQVHSYAAPGFYGVAFDPTDVAIYDLDGNPLPLAGWTDGVVRVPPVTVALQGHITRESTTNPSRTAVTALFFPGNTPPFSWAQTCTDSQGNFYLPVPMEVLTVPPQVPEPPGDPPPGPYEWAFVELEFPNYLSECYWEALDEEVVNIGWHTLEGGDVVQDGCINIYDIVRLIGDFGESVAPPCFVPYNTCPPTGQPGQPAPASDVNGDCAVNIFDLTIAGENFGLCSNCQ